MIKQLKAVFHKSLEAFGFRLIPIYSKSLLEDKEFKAIFDQCKPYTMSEVDNMHALYTATKYIVSAGIPGDFVECGVWKGGSSMLIALTLLHMGETKRKIYLYDTFEGMPEPTLFDKTVTGGLVALDRWKKGKRDTYNAWCFSPLDIVRKNMESTGYPQENFVFVKGKVENTLPKAKHSRIAVLRLDTDFYESTKSELIHLYPKLHKGGVLIVDDYGCWQGVQKAVDEYFHSNPVFLHRVDYTSRLCVKH